jgi:hypothetical protein
MLPIPLMQAKIDVGELKLRDSLISNEGDTLTLFLKGKKSKKDFLFLLRIIQKKNKNFFCYSIKMNVKKVQEYN